ncbi:MAG TPA: transporter substrate-binding domain-containing protein, partial [Gaiellaceae bacterium]
MAVVAIVAAPASAAKNPKIAAEVPKSIASKGSLVVASDATYAPMEFVAAGGKSVVGVDADLAKAIGDVLGLRLKVVNATFDTIIPGIESGKYDVGMSSFTDTKARQRV